MNKFLIILIFLFTSLSFSQKREIFSDIEVMYEFTKKGDTLSVLDSKGYFRLRANKDESIYEKIEEKMIHFNDDEIIKTSNEYFSLESLDDNNMKISLNRYFVYKNIRKDSLLANNSIFNKEFIIGEKLSKMKWNIKDVDTIINKHNCNVATTTFRGRTYEAIYSSEIPLNDGPWKFYGLPGLILNIKSIDGAFEFKALSLNYFSKRKTSYKPTIIKKEISWDKFKYLHQKVLSNMISRLRADSEDGEDINITISNQLEDLGSITDFND